MNNIILNVVSVASPETSNIFVQIIKWLVTVSGSVAIGIVLFTVLLKLITFPFDLFSRISMKKNSIKMEEMRPELEKLQKQYANNKEMYNQKMAALYKKNGYSMVGACFPMIASIVIFIIAINGFTEYGKYQNVKYFHDMANSYNEVIYSSFEVDNEYVSSIDGELVFNNGKILSLLKDNGTNEVTTANGATVKRDKITDEQGNETGIISFKNKNGFVEYKKYYDINTEEFKEKNYFVLVEDTIKNGIKTFASEKNNYLVDEEGRSYNEEIHKDVESFLNEIREYKAAQTFKKENAKFLWVKNIWVKDSPLSHPVNSDVKSFNQEQGSASCSCSGEYKEVVSSDAYEVLTKKLEYEKEAPNGYFILCVLTAGISLLMQFITNKTQKAQMDLQTVDGQGAANRKMMTIMMPIMMAVFSFLYTAAFSIYIIISSIISILNTLFINKIVQVKYEKKEEAKDTGIIRGRVFVPEEPKKEEKKKEKKQKTAKKEEIKGDFLTGPVEEKKHVRGRLK